MFSDTFWGKTLSIYYFKVSKHRGSRPDVQIEYPATLNAHWMPIESPTAAEVVLIYG